MKYKILKFKILRSLGNTFYKISLVCNKIDAYFQKKAGIVYGDDWDSFEDYL